MHGFATGRRVPMAPGNPVFRDTTAMLVLLNDATYFTPTEAADILSDTLYDRPVGYAYNDLLPVTTYYWRLRAVDDLGQEGAWSTVRSFTTDSLRVTRHYYMTDHLGSVRVTVNEEDRVTHYDDYYPFGQQMPGRSNYTGMPPKEHFTGHELETESGMYYAGARYMDPMIGRWMSRDPFEEKHPSWSPYNYVLGNVTNSIDPDGKLVIFVNGYPFNGEVKEAYWSGFANRIMARMGRFEKSYFFDGSAAVADDGWLGYGRLAIEPFFGGSLLPSHREEAGYRVGMEKAAEIFGDLSWDKENPGRLAETVKIFSHSMGAAYARGLARALKEYADDHFYENFRIEWEVDITAFNSAELPVSPFVEQTFQVGHWTDFIAGNLNIPGARRI